MIGSAQRCSVLLLPVPVGRRGGLRGGEFGCLFLLLFRDLRWSLAFRFASSHAEVGVHDCVLLFDNFRLQFVRTLDLRRDRLPLGSDDLGELPLGQLLPHHRQFPLFTHLRAEENPRVLRTGGLDLLGGAGERVGRAGGGAGGVAGLATLDRLRLRRAVIYRVPRSGGLGKVRVRLLEGRGVAVRRPVRLEGVMTRGEKLFGFCHRARGARSESGREEKNDVEFRKQVVDLSTCTAKAEDSTSSSP